MESCGVTWLNFAGCGPRSLRRKNVKFFWNEFFGIFDANDGSKGCRITRLVGVEHIKSKI